MGLTPDEKESIEHELAAFIESKGTESGEAVDRATAIIVASRKAKGREARKEIKVVCTLYLNTPREISHLSKVVKTFLYNARSKHGKPLKATGKHKASPFRLWEKDHLEFIKERMPEEAGSTQPWIVDYSQTASRLWAVVAEEVREEYQELSDALNGARLTPEEQQE